MKISRLCALASVLLLGSAMAFANGIDPKLIISSASGTTTPLSCAGECSSVGFNFSFTVPAGGTGTLFFTNTSGKRWLSLTLVESGVAASAIQCGSNLFKTCTTTTLANGAVAIIFKAATALNAFHGIGNGQTFAMKFSCVNGGCWPDGLHFGAHASPTTSTVVPEPGTMALLATGVVALVSRRKFWKDRATA